MFGDRLGRDHHRDEARGLMPSGGALLRRHCPGTDLWGGGSNIRISEVSGYLPPFGNYLYLPDSSQPLSTIYQIALSPLSGLPRMAFLPPDTNLNLHYGRHSCLKTESAPLRYCHICISERWVSVRFCGVGPSKGPSGGRFLLLASHKSCKKCNPHMYYKKIRK